jgi:hypothetical protein
MLHRAGSGRTDIRNYSTGRSRTSRTAVGPGRMETVALTAKRTACLSQLEMYPPEQYSALSTAICGPPVCHNWRCIHRNSTQHCRLQSADRLFVTTGDVSTGTVLNNVDCHMQYRRGPARGRWSTQMVVSLFRMLSD